ncbi:MAG: hypothetical protein ABI406_19910, partial [Ktedonobacteraceae bacterium]
CHSEWSEESLVARRFFVPLRMTGRGGGRGKNLLLKGIPLRVPWLFTGYFAVFNFPYDMKGRVAVASWGGICNTLTGR